MKGLNKYIDRSNIIKIKEYVNEPTEYNISKVIPNHIEKKNKKIQVARKKGLSLQILLQNLSNKRQINVIQYYAIYGPKNL